MGKIISLNVGLPKEHILKGKEEQTGIGKQPVESIELNKISFANDGVAHTEFHGGVDRAVCLYPFEHYRLWENEFEQKLQIPAFGENLTATNMLEKDVFIGDTFSVGSAIVQVTQGRIPCSMISKFNGINLLGRIVESGFTGYFFRVLVEGTITTDSEIELIERTQEKVTVLQANQIMFHDRKNEKAIKEILEIDELASVWRKKLEDMLEKIN
jgi:MOSC domain-containing protein YiiM